MKNTALVLTRNSAEYREVLAELALPDLEVFVPDSDDERREIAKRANIFFAEPPIARRFIENAHALKWFQSIFAGVDALVGPNLRRDYILTNNRDTYGAPMAEYLLGYILMFEREILENLAAQGAEQWRCKSYPLLSKLTIGVLGTGSIGKEIARVLYSFGVRMLGHNTTGAPTDYFHHTFDAAGLPGLLGQSDYVINVLPSTLATRGLIDRAFLRQMKSSGVFFNLGRGDGVNYDDLVSALEDGVIRAAVLDVFGTEPLPVGDRLWKTKNLFVTPHVSGNIVSRRTFEIFEQNYHRFLSGKELLYRVDFERGY